MTTMEYGEYTAQIDYQPEEKNFFGTVLFINDIVTFEGTSVDELEQAFKDSIEAYVEFCEEFNKKPEKPFSGKTTLRMPPELHKELSKAAVKEGFKSFNEFAITTLKASLQPKPQYAIEEVSELFKAIKTIDTISTVAKYHSGPRMFGKTNIPTNYNTEVGFPKRTQ